MMLRMFVRTFADRATAAPMSKKPPFAIFAKVGVPSLGEGGDDFIGLDDAAAYIVLGSDNNIGRFFIGGPGTDTDENISGRLILRNCREQCLIGPAGPNTDINCKGRPVTSCLEGRYVSALYSAASQINELENVEKALIDIQKVLKKPKIMDFMSTSLISRADKAKLLSAIGTEAGMPKTATNFLGLVAENGRLEMLDRMIRLFLAVMVAHRNEALCEVITADPLDDATRTALVNILKKFVSEGKKIQLREIVAPDIIGGVVIGFEDKHIDMSIAKRMTLYRGRIKYIKYQ